MSGHAHSDGKGDIPRITSPLSGAGTASMAVGKITKDSATKRAMVESITDAGLSSVCSRAKERKLNRECFIDEDECWMNDKLPLRYVFQKHNERHDDCGTVKNYFVFHHSLVNTNGMSTPKFA